MATLKDTKKTGDTKTTAAKAEAKKVDTVAVETKKAEPAKKTAVKVEAKKTTVKAEPKKAEPKKAEPKKAAAKKTTTKAAKKSETKATVYVQYLGKEFEAKAVLDAAKSAYIKETGAKEADIKTIDLYIKPEDNAAYYVVNGKSAGSVAL
ncbi:MAG: DUF6465 family protein [Eubacterium sp.]